MLVFPIFAIPLANQEPILQLISIQSFISHPLKLDSTQVVYSKIPEHSTIFQKICIISTELTVYYSMDGYLMKYYVHDQFPLILSNQQNLLIICIIQNFQLLYSVLFQYFLLIVFKHIIIVIVLYRPI